MNVITIENASFSYPGEAPALSGVSFDVRAGEAVALIGPNGAGKSTLLNGLLGLLPHSATRFEVPRGRGDIGVLPQHAGVDVDFPVTLEQVVAMGRIVKQGLRWPSRSDRELVQRALEAVELTAMAKRRFGELSGGQRQRGLLARALAGQPKVLLLDEPFNGLDQHSRERLIDIVERLKATGVALIVTTHELELAQRVCERTILVNGEQIAFDQTECVLTLEHVAETFAQAAIEIDGHTLATADHHANEHAGHHEPQGRMPRGAASGDHS